MADVAMKILGKATGGREAAAHLIFVLCVECCVCVRCFLPVNFWGEITVEFFVRSRYIIGRINQKKITRSVQLKLK